MENSYGSIFLYLQKIRKRVYSPVFFSFFLAALAAFFSFGVLDAAVLPVLGLPSFSFAISFRLCYQDIDI